MRGGGWAGLGFTLSPPASAAMLRKDGGSGGVGGVAVLAEAVWLVVAGTGAELCNMSLLVMNAEPWLQCSVEEGVAFSAGLDLTLLSGFHSLHPRLVLLDREPPVMRFVSTPASLTGASVAAFAVSCSDASACTLSYVATTGNVSYLFYRVNDMPPNRTGIAQGPATKSSDTAPVFKLTSLLRLRS